MVECYDCELSGEQWGKQTCYVAELKKEWTKEEERSSRHMAHLAEAEKRLARSSGQRLAPGILPRSMSLLDWSLWQAKLDMQTRATKWGRPVE